MIKYIDYTELPTDAITIDVRSQTEYRQDYLMQYNIPIMNEADHQVMRKYLIVAMFIIMYKIHCNKEFILENMTSIVKEDPNRKFVIACSRGRLRSPLTAIYVRYKLDIEVYVLRNGVRFNEQTSFLKKWLKI